MKKRSDAALLAYIALGSALICLCAWICLPSPLPFTLQTLGVFFVLCLLGGARGSVSVLIYVAMGALGLPVFSGFRAGIGVLLGATGGYIVGFLGAALVFWLISAIGKNSQKARILGCAAGLCVCYLAGGLWYAVGYSSSISAGFVASLAQSVVPFIIPDIIKIITAFVLAEIVKRRTQLKFL